MQIDPAAGPHALSYRISLKFIVLIRGYDTLGKYYSTNRTNLILQVRSIHKVARQLLYSMVWLLESNQQNFLCVQGLISRLSDFLYFSTCIYCSFQMVGRSSL